MIIRQARFDEHKAIFEIAKQSKYTRDFSNHIFSGEAMYEKGWIRVYDPKPRDGGSLIWGFTCVRHKVRTPVTELYFITVDKNMDRAGIGRALMEDLLEQSPHKRVQLNVMKENPAVGFYDRLGCTRIGESMGGKAWRYEYTP